MFRTFRRAATAALGLGVIAVAAAGCTGGTDASSPAVSTTLPSGSAPLTSSKEEVARAEALKTYRGMWEDMVTAGKSSDHKSPLLARHATGNALKQIVQTLYGQAQDGQVSRGAPVLNPRVDELDLSKTPVRAVVEDCADSSKWLLYKTSGEKVNDVPGGRRRISADVRAVAGVWKVVDFRVRQVGSC